MISFKPKFLKKVYLVIPFFLLIISAILLMALEGKYDSVYFIIVLLLIAGIIHLLFFKLIKKILFDDSQQRLIVNYYFYPGKVIFYKEIIEIKKDILITEKGTIHTDLLSNIDDFLELINQRQELASKVKKPKVHKETNGIGYAYFGLAVIISILLIYILESLDFLSGKYSELWIGGCIFAVFFVINRFLIRNTT